MAHHVKKEEKNIDNLYYLVGLVFGLITGAVLEVGIKWVIVGGVLGLLSSILFLRVFVRGREQR